MASHGADQLIVQRLLACRGLRDAQKALIGSGLPRHPADVALPRDRRRCSSPSSTAADRSVRGGRFRDADEVFPTFIVRQPAAARVGVPRRGDLLGRDVLGVFGAELARLGARDGHRRPADGEEVRWKAGAASSSGRVLTLFWTLVLAAPRGRVLAPAAVTPGRAGRARARERDGRRPPRRLSPRALRAEGDADGRDVGIATLGGLHARALAGLEGLGSRSRSGRRSRGRGTPSSARRSRSGRAGSSPSDAVPGSPVDAVC